MSRTKHTPVDRCCCTEHVGLDREAWETVLEALGSKDSLAIEEARDLLTRDAPLSWTEPPDG